MKIFKSAVMAVMASFAILMSPMIGAAHAGDPVIDAAKSSGQVGEKIDSYLAVVGDADGAVSRKVDEINAKRREYYAKLASEKGQPLTVIARLTGEKLIAGESSGNYVFDDSGQWVIKP